MNEDSPDLTVFITPSVNNTSRNDNEDIYSPQTNLPRGRLQFHTDPMDNSRNSSGIDNSDPLNSSNAPPDQSVPASVPRFNGLRPYLASSTLPSNKYSAVSLNDLMKEDVRIRNKYIVLQLLKIVSGSSSSANIIRKRINTSKKIAILGCIFSGWQIQKGLIITIKEV